MQHKDEDRNLKRRPSSQADDRFARLDEALRTMVHLATASQPSRDFLDALSPSIEATPVDAGHLELMLSAATRH